MKVEIECPEHFQGPIIGDLISRRGMIVNTDMRDGITNILAEVPLAETFGYATDIRSMTQGQGTFTMELAMLPQGAGQRPGRHHRREEEGPRRRKVSSRFQSPVRQSCRSGHLQPRPLVAVSRFLGEFRPFDRKKAPPARRAPRGRAFPGSAQGNRVYRSVAD